ncbi:uncharacterized protein LOC120641279 [Panicum virgatum]|uniref:Uncharacterized protein n=1 Tax=Panicum virgatum TaxID=38727 RepID=A0A8T0XTA0_PANVG|nr:uncharacterized protein LOC120641279 [Panicum virgatum]KAG2661456.1 hypothetical protein PVAP13_1KG505100 [Panicum virgatum]
MKRLLAHAHFGCPSRGLVEGRSSAVPALCNSVLPHYRYYSAEKHQHVERVGEIGEKARSTAEEFVRVAKEKTDEVTEGAKETLHEAKEAVVGESDDEKEKFKRRVEEGRYHQK